MFYGQDLTGSDPAIFIFHMGKTHQATVNFFLFYVKLLMNYSWKPQNRLIKKENKSQITQIDTDLIFCYLS